MNGFPAEAEVIGSTGVEVFNENIGFFNQFCHDFLAVGGLCVERKRFLVGVQLKEVIARSVGRELNFVAGSIANTGTFDFDYFCTEPCKHLST